MSTRSNIYLKLKDESKGKTIKFDITKLPQGTRGDGIKYPIKDVKIPKRAKYMGIYHHWDGYISGGVGETLQTHYKDYDTILNLLMMGDISTINDGVECYQGWRNEDCPAVFFGKTMKIKRWDRKKNDWKDSRVQMEDENGNPDPKKLLREEYAYLFDGEKWWVSYYRYDDEKDDYIFTGWCDLAEELAKEKAEENK